MGPQFDGTPARLFVREWDPFLARVVLRCEAKEYALHMHEWSSGWLFAVLVLIFFAYSAVLNDSLMTSPPRQNGTMVPI